MFEIFWKTVYRIFSCFKQPQHIDVINYDDIEYGELPDDMARLSIKIPQYNFVMIKD